MVYYNTAGKANEIGLNLGDKVFLLIDNCTEIVHVSC